MCSSTKNHDQEELPPTSQKHWRPWEVPIRSSHFAPKSPSPLKCEEPVCKGNVTFKRESELRRHTLSKHLKKHERCPECRKVFTRKDNLTRHIKLKHNSDEKPLCKFCAKSLSRRDAVQRHESTCSKNPSKKSYYTFKLGRYPTHMQRIRMKHQRSQLSSRSGNLKIEDEMNKN